MHLIQFTVKICIKPAKLFSFICVILEILLTLLIMAILPF